MKFIVALLLTAFLGYVAPLFFPWWSFAVTSFIVAFFIHQRAGFAFLAGFLGVFFMWGIYAFMLDAANQHLLSQKVAQILPLGGSSMLLLLLSACIGGLVSGFAAITASFTRKPSNTSCVCKICSLVCS